MNKNPTPLALFPVPLRKKTQSKQNWFKTKNPHQETDPIPREKERERDLNPKLSISKRVQEPKNSTYPSVLCVPTLLDPSLLVLHKAERSANTSLFFRLLLLLLLTLEAHYFPLLLLSFHPLIQV